MRSVSGTFVTAFPESSVPKSGAYNTIIHHTHTMPNNIFISTVPVPFPWGIENRGKYNRDFYFYFFAIVSFANKAKIVHLKLQ
jgi:hypothetical protein